MSKANVWHTLCFALLGQALFGQITIVSNDFPEPMKISPGEITTVRVTGLRTRFDGALRATNFPLPRSMQGISVTLTGGSFDGPVPLFGIEQFNNCVNDRSLECLVTVITMQTPVEMDESSSTMSSLKVIENGVESRPFRVSIQGDTVHVLHTCDLLFVGGDHRPGPQCTPLVTHFDGTLVSAGSPARVGETITIYATGLGKPGGAVSSGMPSPTPAVTVGNILSGTAILFNQQINTGPTRPDGRLVGPGPAKFVGLTPGFAGLYQINVEIIGPIVPGNSCVTGPSFRRSSNLTITIARPFSFDGAGICVAP